MGCEVSSRKTKFAERSYSLEQKHQQDQSHRRRCIGSMRTDLDHMLAMRRRERHRTFKISGPMLQHSVLLNVLDPIIPLWALRVVLSIHHRQRRESGACPLLLCPVESTKVGLGR